MIFAPSSITAFFSPKIHSDPKKSGSIGVGIALNEGVVAKKSEEEGVYFNGSRIRFPTVEHVLRKLGLKGVYLETKLPLSCGLGLSGASALATAFLSSNSDYLFLCDLAHEAEVINKTGLGDVVTQTHGGVVARISEGAPSLAKVKKFFFNATIDVIVLGKIDTAEFLSSYNLREISRIGEECLKEFLKKPSLENLFDLSKRFAIETGLGEEVKDVIEAVEANGGRASMAMLGKTVFAINGREAFGEFSGLTFSARIRNCGVDANF